MEYATLSSSGSYTFFSYGGKTIKFRTSDRLVRYTKIVRWDKGFIVVMAKYTTLGEVEEYIDLVPILENLYFDAESFLEPIKEVRLKYD